MDVGVLTVVCLLLGVLAIRAGARALSKRNESEGRAGRAWWAVVVMVAGLTAWFVEASHQQRQFLTSDALSVLTENPDARANCKRFTESLLDTSQFDGFVYWDNLGVAHFKGHICKDLAAYARGGQANPTLDQVAAVVLVAHESQHMLNIRSESVAECNAVQDAHKVAMHLGATMEQALALQARYFVEIYPHQRSEYVSRECREGGSLDIYPDRTEFP
ncbi:MAG: hypothetical protein CVT64_05630 [Actinobacteria bacterium HGW-Actinobacteria-4]|nr:MAG: hypothetical protein CVT64_05630 [Actinobacteria bacterium HGW-Actinobacteria-4]